MKLISIIRYHVMWCDMYNVMWCDTMISVEWQVLTFVFSTISLVWSPIRLDILSIAPKEQNSTVQCSTVQYSTVQYSTVQHSTAQHSTAQHSTAQHSTAQHITAQHSTAQHSTAQNRTASIFIYYYHYYSLEGNKKFLSKCFFLPRFLNNIGIKSG